MMDLLRQQLVADNDYFKKLIGLVPSSFAKDDAESNETDFGLAEVSVRDRLHKKIEVLKGKRIKPGQPVESVEKKRLKRKLSKAKLRQKRKAEKQQNSADNKTFSSIAKKSLEPDKPKFNKDGNVVFSKFEFSENGSAKGKHKGGTMTGKNFKVLLDNVEKQKNSIKKIRETNPARASAMEEKLKWKTVLSKAEGTKVRDNPELLKNSMKTLDKKKDHSRKKWEERESKLAQQMKNRQDKRSKNIAKKKEGRKEKKVKLAKKRGRVVV